MATFSPAVESAIADAAAKYGVDPGLMRTFARIESGGNPNNVTGSYRGLYQLSPQEFARYGGGDIYDPSHNAAAAAAKLAAESASFEAKYGRRPTAADLYLIHQQGEGGSAAHWANPDAPAWQNMLSTAEGRQKGEAWAKAAIWGNVPDDVKRQYGSVDNITSGEFTRLWGDKVARLGGDGDVAPIAEATPSSGGGISTPAQSASAPDQPSAQQSAIKGFGAIGEAMLKSQQAQQAAQSVANDQTPLLTPAVLRGGKVQTAAIPYARGAGGPYQRAVGGGIDTPNVPRRSVLDDPSATALFLGENAKTANQDALAMAKTMADYGATRDDIWAATRDQHGQPWWREDGRWWFETQQKVPYRMRDEEPGTTGAQAYPKEVLDAYPNLASDTVVTTRLPPNVLGTASPGLIEMAPNQGEIRGTLTRQHEIGHRVQQVEKAPMVTGSGYNRDVPWGDRKAEREAEHQAIRDTELIHNPALNDERGLSEKFRYPPWETEKMIDWTYRTFKPSEQMVDERVRIGRAASLRAREDDFNRAMKPYYEARVGRKVFFSPDHGAVDKDGNILMFDPKGRAMWRKPEQHRAEGGGVDDSGQNAPESRETLLAQQRQLIEGRRPAQMFPVGTAELPLPPGMRRIETQRGVFHYDPQAISPEQIREASQAGRENDVLGLGPLSKDDVVGTMAKTGEAPIAIVERDPAGREVRGSVATPSTVAEQMPAMISGSSPENAVGLEPLDAVVRERGMSDPAERALRLARAEGGSVDDGPSMKDRIKGWLFGPPKLDADNQRLYDETLAAHPSIKGMEPVPLGPMPPSMGILKAVREHPKTVATGVGGLVAGTPTEASNTGQSGGDWRSMVGFKDFTPMDRETFLERFSEPRPTPPPSQADYVQRAGDAVRQAADPRYVRAARVNAEQAQKDAERRYPSLVAEYEEALRRHAKRQDDNYGTYKSELEKAEKDYYSQPFGARAPAVSATAGYIAPAVLAALSYGRMRSGRASDIARLTDEIAAGSLPPTAEALKRAELTKLQQSVPSGGFKGLIGDLGERARFSAPAIAVSGVERGLEDIVDKTLTPPNAGARQKVNERFTDPSQWKDLAASYALRAALPFTATGAAGVGPAVSPQVSARAAAVLDDAGRATQASAIARQREILRSVDQADAVAAADARRTAGLKGQIDDVAQQHELDALQRLRDSGPSDAVHQRVSDALDQRTARLPGGSQPSLPAPESSPSPALPPPAASSATGKGPTPPSQGFELTSPANGGPPVRDPVPSSDVPRSLPDPRQLDMDLTVKQGLRDLGPAYRPIVERELISGLSDPNLRELMHTRSFADHLERVFKIEGLPPIPRPELEQRLENLFDMTRAVNRTVQAMRPRSDGTPSYNIGQPGIQKAMGLGPDSNPNGALWDPSLTFAIPAAAGIGTAVAPGLIQRDEPDDMPERANGGGISAPISGALYGATGGRADKVPGTVRAGSHVIPADIVAHMGQGNSNAGLSALEKMFKTGPYGMPLQRRHKGFAGGGEASPDEVPVRLSDGEFVIDPETVAEIGGGDMALGHDVLDNWIMNTRKQHIAQLASLPPPATD